MTDRSAKIRAEATAIRDEDMAAADAQFAEAMRVALEVRDARRAEILDAYRVESEGLQRIDQIMGDAEAKIENARRLVQSAASTGEAAERIQKIKTEQNAVRAAADAAEGFAIHANVLGEGHRAHQHWVLRNRIANATYAAASQAAEMVYQAAQEEVRFRGWA